MLAEPVSYDLAANDEGRLSLWDLPPDQLVTTLVDLVEHGTGAAAYYADILDAVVSLSVTAPCGVPSMCPTD